jgi:hypothetical protein
VLAWHKAPPLAGGLFTALLLLSCTLELSSCRTLR